MDEEFVRDLFASEGPVQLRRLFGGKGIYLDGLIVAVMFGDQLLLKGDDQTGPLFEAAGSRRWTYQRPGKASVTMPYYDLPSEAYDDPDAMAVWARRAWEAAMRAAQAKSGKRRPKPPR
ncbi:competence protein TfoX [Aureimonas endophytica]|uniref:Competence protein TfoX n=1 Tax=Aureimonas endophytica TaxID=2027858 RepID=A0A916ZD17_9HYPH|nr:TfoX/Sxy family protein [Aureimonas endophytica]GGD88705.1 competence protein TfoX [Aureimonas endophytica]